MSETTHDLKQRAVAWLVGVPEKKRGGLNITSNESPFILINDLLTAWTQAQAALVQAEQARIYLDERLKEHQIGLTQCRMDKADVERAKVQAEQEKAELRLVCEESNAVCSCGCPTSEHENYGDEGEACTDDTHECQRISKAAYSVIIRLRARLATQEATIATLADESRKAFERETEHTGLRARYMAQEATIRQVEQEMLKYYSPDRETVLRWADTLRAILPAEQTAVKGPDAPQADR